MTDSTSSNHNRDIPILLNFDDKEVLGIVRLTYSSYPLLEDYVLVPSLNRKSDGTIEILSYSYVHKDRIEPRKS